MDTLTIINIRNELEKRDFLWDTQNHAYMNDEAYKNGWEEISEIVDFDERFIKRHSVYMKLDLFFDKHVFVDVGKYNYRATLKKEMIEFIECLQKCDSHKNNISWMIVHHNLVNDILKTNNLIFFEFSTIKFYEPLTLREEIARFIEDSANIHINECKSSSVKKKDIKKFSNTIKNIANSPLKGIVYVEPPPEVPDFNHMMLNPFHPPMLPDSWFDAFEKLMDHDECQGHIKVTNSDCEDPVINIRIENTTETTKTTVSTESTDETTTGRTA